jgi:hypothetical protein
VKLVDSADWPPPSRSVPITITAQLLLLDQDIISAQLALAAFVTAKRDLRGRTAGPLLRVAVAVTLHNARVFVCAMRRAGRMLESINKARAGLPKELASACALAWRKRRKMLASYIVPRNAIEHIDSEVNGRTNIVLLNLSNDDLVVSPRAKAPISLANLESLIIARMEILAAIRQIESEDYR